MAIDRSFSHRSALERFLDRCPRIAVNPEFEYLFKGDNVKGDDLFRALGKIFLHPNYTIPLVGCFRPIVDKIVEEAVKWLRLVPDLRYNLDDSMVEFDEGKFLREDEDLDNGELNNIYSRNRKGLNLHEIACLAFCRALNMVPDLWRPVLDYFQFAPPPFERVKLMEHSCEELMVGDQLLNVVRASYRFLLAKPEVFNTQWDWSCFLDLVQLLSNIDLVEDEVLQRNILDIRWCAIRILSFVLKIHDTASSGFDIGTNEANSCLLRWEEFCQDVSLEIASWNIEISAARGLSFSADGCNSDLNNCSLGTGRIREPLHQCSRIREPLYQCSRIGKPFYLTSALRKSYEMVFLSVSQKRSVLLHGPAGCGKTALINKLAQDQQSQVLSIHLDDQIDGKTLLGSYVCTEQPDEFRWQPGSLTQAVSRGFWVIFEDIDKAPPDVHSILSPLLEGASLFLTGQGEAIRVHEDFRLFSTVTMSKLGKNSLSGFWQRVTVVSPEDGDLRNIVNAWYPKLDPLAGKLIETFKRMNQSVGFQFKSTASYCSHGRFSLRDLLKWCKRIDGLLSIHDGGLSTISDSDIYKEAVDVFAASSTTAKNRMAMMNVIARLWGVPTVELLLPFNKPLIQEWHAYLRIGRVQLERINVAWDHNKKQFVEISSSIHTLERIACSVKFNEPVLLVGETGSGKTTLVQSLAARVGQKLTVLNLSQQSDVADLLGGFQPNDLSSVLIPLYKEFENLFIATFSSKDNRDFLNRLQTFVTRKDWKMLVMGFGKCVKQILKIGKCGSGKKRKRPLGEEVLRCWESFSLKLERADAQVSGSGGMIFSFVEGAFVTALKNGEWILLDEINLAPPEVLQRLIGVLEEERGSLCLAERGDIDYISRHPDFRIFACMNPATDAGKRDLPLSLRGRFTEYFVDEVLDDEDLVLFVNQYLGDTVSIDGLVRKIVDFYKAAKKESEERLQDGANQKPQYSLRSLYRALEYTRKARKKFEFQKALYDGFCMFFLTSLDEASAKLMNQMIISYLLGGKMPRQLSLDSLLSILLEREMLSREKSRSDPFLESYVLTKSIEEHLNNLARAVFVGRYPVLLQGPTSSGKTSLVKYLAAKTGHKFVRINNHEHTDLQEYLGSYITDSRGKLVFHEGALVKAIRNGHWIVLDELNLAPSDVLEALNRLLDDNRELYVPELHEVVCAHPNFMLFATQNPPNIYGGRKMLSRAFRNRFVEIHVDEIPLDELRTILEKRCEVPPSYAKKMVDVMKELQLYRQSSKVFAGKEGYITPRDLFRWASRYKVLGRGYEDLARDGYYLLAERLREDTERRFVREVLERQLRVKLAEDEMYNLVESSVKLAEDETHKLDIQGVDKINWTRSMRRLYFLVNRCYELREPVLLVGETGGGKTTVCQLLSSVLHSKLHILNCHQYTETSDFIGGFFPVRERSTIVLEFKELCNELKCKVGEIFISSDINQASQTLDKLAEIINSCGQGQVLPQVSVEDLKNIYGKLDELHSKWQSIFIWQDGPLVEAMKKGDLFLVDEISLADDSVLERLNSVLEPERKLTLAEKGGSELETITANSKFFLLATMNPGGDHGKKELSPALRNRFTEIWVPSVDDLNELRCIGLEKISSPKLTSIVDVMLHFWDWFNRLETGKMLTVRDFLSWVSFVNHTEDLLESEHSLLHGAFLVLLDGLNLGANLSKVDMAQLRKKCLAYLLKKIEEFTRCLDYSAIASLEYYGWSDPDAPWGNGDERMQCDNRFGIHPFYIEKGDENCDVGGFKFLAPTTRRNALRVLRAMQLTKPVLLEGSPGVGKTSLIVSIGKFSGHKVVRINLSEQTDIMDLLGSDLPVESDKGMQFAWSDGILLQALKMGSWVLLDELNLASQSVLEGLNAILDHRAEVFIPELGRTFKCPKSFRIFACQNPSHQGGGRKGLPKSFLNRFTKVYADELSADDYESICTSLYPSIPVPILKKLTMFNKRLHEETMLYHNFAQDGSPWEFNLRDVVRSCEIIQGADEKSKSDCFLNTVFVQRMRTPADRLEVIKLYEQVFERKPYINPLPRVTINPQYLIVGNTSIKRNHYQSTEFLNSQLKILPGLLSSLEAVGNCVRHQWLCILVGPPSSGKTSLVRLLAQLTGNVLNEVNISPATDTSELLGCFEQHNPFRSYCLVVDDVERYMKEYANLQLDSSTVDFMKKKDLLSRWLHFLSTHSFELKRSSTSTDVETWRNECIESVPLMREIIENLRFVLEKETIPVSWSIEDLDRNLLSLRKFQANSFRGQYSAKFEWRTGVLLKAIEKGEWIVLENANLCNPTVLDRINSLVEHSGSITVNECGTVDGQPVILHPHPQFRMFLTVNPSFGEVSRAMRNRGVEVYVMQPSWLPGEDCGNKFEEAELRDARRFVALAGVPHGRLVDLMAKAHVYAKNEAAKFDTCFTVLELAHWVQLFKQLVIRGNQPIQSLQVSWEHAYLSPLGEDKGKIAQSISSYLSAVEIFKIDKFQDSLICLPGGWPTPLNTRDFVLYSRETCVRRNCMYLEFLGVQCASYSFWKEQSGATNHFGRIYLMNVRQLAQMMFPRALLDNVASYGEQEQFNLNLAKEMLFFAANWTMEQAVESDIKFYLCWFRWFSSQLEPFCSFFSSYADILEEEFKHPVWVEIYSCRGKLLRHHSINLDAFPIPILSMDLVGLSVSNVGLKSDAKHLGNSIKSVELVRLSHQQWRSEREHVDDQGTTKRFEPLLEALQGGEKEVLKVLVGPNDVLFQLYDGLLENHREGEMEVLKLLVEPTYFDVLFQLYDGLLENHKQLWSGIISSYYEAISVSLRSLLKTITRIQYFCCKKDIQVSFRDGPLVLHKDIEYMDSVSFSNTLRSLKSLQWVHDGHQFMPSSGDIYLKQQQLIDHCKLVWPSKTKFWKYLGVNTPIEVVSSFNSKLRYFTMQGVSMFAYIVGEADKDDFSVIHELEQKYQMLIKWLKFEYQMLTKQLKFEEYQMHIKRLEFEYKLEEHVLNSEQTPLHASICCSFSPDLLCRSSDFCSWQDELPLPDNASFFQEAVILSELSRISLFDLKEQSSGLSNLMDDMECALRFGLYRTSRSPMDLVPHQKILWTVKSWSSIPDSNAKITGYVLEMWSRWHRFLWTQYPLPPGRYGNGILPDRLFRFIKCETVEGMLQNLSSIGDFPLRSLRLKVASCDLWRGGPIVGNIKCFLLSAARSLFQQIIYSQRKSVFSISQTRTITKDDIERVVSDLGFKSLLYSLIQPVLSALYDCGAEMSIFQLGCVWLRIGRLRYHLLTPCNDLDPAVEYAIKYSQLMAKIASLDLEIEVRRECNLSAGFFQVREDDDYRVRLLENLRSQQIRMQRQVVFRSNPGNYKKLRHELMEFGKNDFVSVTGSIDNVDSMSIEQMITQFQNWQVTATSFMDCLSSEYSSYVDLVEPVQVAIHEIKLGLSLILSSAMDKRVLERFGQQNRMDLVLDSVYTFMRFPRKCSSRAVFVKNENEQYCPASSRIHWLETLKLQMQMLEQLITFIGEVKSDEVTVQHLRFALHKNILQRVAHSIAEVRLFDNASFDLLSERFEEFAISWMQMKIQVKKKEDDEAQQFKFRPRAFRIENLIDLDISSLGSSVAVETFNKWKEFHSGEEFKEETNIDEVKEILAEDWNAIEESILSDTVGIHNKLFGSVDLVKSPGIVDVCDEEILSSFTDSYSLGIQMIKSLEGTMLSDIEAKLMPEYILRICLEHEQTTTHKRGHTYNFYKDSNAPIVAEMVDPIVNLRHLILDLLKEREGHPALQRLLDAVDMVLAIPLGTPLAKVLSGLQFLLKSVWDLQETVTRNRLEEYLRPLVSSLQKLEFESALPLLDEVEVQFEVNAASLWFPLYSILLLRDTDNIEKYREDTIQSLDEFICMSNIGEFKRRLQLLVAFHGQILSCVRLGADLSPCKAETLKILYNKFGFYIQFLPKILDHIKANRKTIEAELKDLKKFYQWEHTVDYASIENSRRACKKLRMIVEKYTKQLKEPATPFLPQENPRTPASLSRQSPLDLVDSFESKRNILERIYQQANFRDENRLSRFVEYLKKLDLVSQSSHHFKNSGVVSPDFSFKDVDGEVMRFINVGVPPQFMLKKGTKIWDTIGEVCKNVISCCDIWRKEHKPLRKRRVFTDLLKVLESCGLLKHRSSIPEELATNNWRYWLQPSYDVQHLLLQISACNGGVDIVAPSNLKNSSSGSLESEWRDANSFYFKGIASMQEMKRICHGFNKDFTLEQVRRSCSFVEHLIEVLQDQRAAAYGFADQLKYLRECIRPLANLVSDSFAGPDCCESFTPNQYAIYNCMWQQKQILDNLSTTMREVCLLLQKVKSAHLDSCPNIKADVEQISGLVDTFAPRVQTFKDSLDLHLLGNNKVIVGMGALLHPYGVTKQMEQLVGNIFEFIREFEYNFSALSREGKENGAVKSRILAYFRDVFEKATTLSKQYDSDLEKGNQSQDVIEEANIQKLEVDFHDAFWELYTNMRDAVFMMLPDKNRPLSDEESLTNICQWKTFFQSDAESLKLEVICDGMAMLNTVTGKLLNCCFKKNSKLCSLVGSRLGLLYPLLDVILAFGDGLLHDFLSMHGMVSALAHALAGVFSSLFAKGFGVPEDQIKDSEMSQDARGTGMGEGTGLNDVSDQIEDEDQLLGSSDQPNKDGVSEAPSKNNKGIEMEHDFDADILSVSEGSGDDEDDDGNEDEQLESAMGETGDSGEIAKEKPWDNNDDENPPETDEKYESGQAVKDNETIDKELRAKNDPASATEAGENIPEQLAEQGEENGNEVAPHDMEDEMMDKEDSFSDLGGLNLDEPNQGFDEDGDVDETNGTEPMETHDNEDLQDSADIENSEEKTDWMDETLEEKALDNLDETSKIDNQEDDHESERQTDCIDQNPTKETSQLGPSEAGEEMPTFETSNPLKPEYGATDFGDAAAGAKWSNVSDLQDDLAPSRGIADSLHAEISFADISNGRKSGNNSFEAPIPSQDMSNQKIKPNPFRSIGDALDGWKERVKVSVDLDEKNPPANDINDETANEYGYTAEFEKGTAQALGPATADQMEKNMMDRNLENDTEMKEIEDCVTDMEVDNQSSDTNHIPSSIVNHTNDMERQPEKLELEVQPEELTKISSNQDRETKLLQSLVSVSRSYLSEDSNEFSKLSLSDYEPSKANRLEEVPSDVRENAAIVWRRYELLTTRLSQELKEQLRLVMEPTLASKLQGDYKTGKRINMKKVIPYIASHYRKDKIWLRRTRPNKRDYQVVIAVDDSRSMQENQCGNVAIEALVTVCRAMSQLDVGKLAVASFGKTGNIRLLHDFDQPFTGEAGTKMISSLTFKQENTIADEPVVDLLKYLNNMLDAAVANARLSSGHNPLEQLVLIIADGRFHEKESLKRYVRELLSKKRMVAFLLLDSPGNSIMDLEEATIQGGNVIFSKYLDSFPFPYYVVLRNIEALPRTLADLLRQWFEIMQNSRE